MNIITKKIELPDGRTIEIETGKVAKQADGSAVVRMGGTVLLATVTCASEVVDGTDFLPLQVDYKEKYYSAGRYPGGFMKREGKASDYEVLVSRLVDRALRPLFPDDFHLGVFVNVWLLSAEKDIQPDALAGLAASAALAASDLPFLGPISEVRIARIGGEFKINPSFSEMEEADLDMMVAATEENIMMVEGEMKEVSESVMLEAIKAAHAAIKPMCQIQKELNKELGKDVKRDYPHDEEDEDLRKAVHDECYGKCYELAKAAKPKKEREAGFEQIKADFVATLSEEDQEAKAGMIARYFAHEQREALRNLVLDEGLRVDGRQTTQVRPIWCEHDVLPCVHGSAIFTRGETQSLATVTLGTKKDMKELDEVLIQGDQQFVLHYNFPPFATGDAKAQRGVGRREIGHGNLAMRALKPVIPMSPENPYAVRVVSDILESNGSSSQASICGGCLALMDAGVQISKMVSGVAMGLITDAQRPNDRYAILTDILGDEDHLGDMDFKVAGTEDGITATQMDIKVDGLSYDVLEKALQQAHEGRMHILGEMRKCMDKPREDYKEFVPRIKSFEIDKEFIGAVIGKGGETIQKIQAETGAEINIDEVDGKGIVDIATNDAEAMEKAYKWIMSICEVPEAGKVYHGKVVSILDFGAFVEILPGKEGLLHVSEIAWEKTENVTDVLSEGQEIDVKLLEIDEKSGKMRLSMKALQPKPEGYVEPERRPRGNGSRDDRGRNGRDDRRSGSREGGRRDEHRSGRDDRRGGSREGGRRDEGRSRDGRRDDRRQPRRDENAAPRDNFSADSRDDYSRDDYSDNDNHSPSEEFF